MENETKWENIHNIFIFLNDIIIVYYILNYLKKVHYFSVDQFKY